MIPTKTNFAAASNLTAPLVVCCPQTPMESSSRNELGKLRYAFTPSTLLTYRIGSEHRELRAPSKTRIFRHRAKGITVSRPRACPIRQAMQNSMRARTTARI